MKIINDNEYFILFNLSFFKNKIMFSFSLNEAFDKNDKNFDFYILIQTQTIHDIKQKQ